MIRYSSYHRILVSYLVILGVSMITLTLIGYSMVTRAAYREAAGHSAELAERVRTAVDREIAHITAIAHAIDRDFEIRHPQAFGDPPDVMTIQRRFSALVSTNRFVQEVIYAARGVQPYIGSTGVLSPTAVLFAYARRDVLDGYRFNQVVESVRRPGFILLRETMEADGPFLFYAHPLGLRTDRPAVAVFVIPTANLLSVVTGVATTSARAEASQATGHGRAAGSFVLIDPYGTVVLAHPSVDRSVLSTAVQYARTPATSDSSSTRVGRHVVARATSLESGWTTALLIPIEATTAIARDALQGLLIVVLLLIVIEIVLLEIFLRWNYRPVSVLLEDVEHPDRPNTMIDRRLPSELSAVHTALHDAHRLQAADRATRELGAAVMMEKPDAATMSMLIERIGMDTAAPGYRVLAARVPESTGSLAAGTTVVRSGLEPLGLAVQPVAVTPRTIEWLVAGPDQPPVEAIERMYARLVTAVGSVLHIGVGPFVRRVEDIGQSMREAHDAALGARLRECTMIDRSAPDDHEGASGTVRFSRDVMAAVERAIESDGPVETVATIESLIERFRAAPARSADLIGDALSLSALVGRRIAQSPAEDSGDWRPRLIERLHDADASLLDGALSLESFGRALCSIVDDADRAREIRWAGSGANESRAQQIVSYVEEHLFDPNLSLASVARSVGVSLSTAGTLFKRSTGTVLTGFVGERRIAEAKRLLREGIPVNDVVDKIGYRDSTSFIRKFKRMTGTTPGDWLRGRTGSVSARPVPDSADV